jgi:hypothetical protein
LGVNVVVAAAAPAPLPAVVVRVAAGGFLAAGFWAGFLAGADAAGAAFLAGAFLAVAGAALRGGDVLLADDADLLVVVELTFFAPEVGFLAAGAAFLVAVAAFFTTGAAFFFVWTERFVAVAPTLVRADLFPEDDVRPAAAVRGADTLLAWVPLLAGVIVPSSGPRDGPRSCSDLALGSG